MNICFEWIFWIFKKWIFFWKNSLDFLKKMIIWFEWIFWIFKKWLLVEMVVAKCLKLIWNQSGIISRTYFSPFQGVYYLYRGLRRAPKPYFCLILEFWIIFLIFYEWIILLNILDSVEWIFFWMNIFDFGLNWILNWIIFRPDSMKKWIFKTYQTGLYKGDYFFWWRTWCWWGWLERWVLFDAEEVITFLCKLWNRSWAFLIVHCSLAIFSAGISVTTSSSGN